MESKLFGPPQALWCLKLIQNRSPKFSEDNGIENAISCLFFSDWDTKDSFLLTVLLSSKTYGELCKIIFGFTTEDPLLLLQSKGYFQRGDTSILSKPLKEKEGSQKPVFPNKVIVDVDPLIPVLECFMWAYMDNCFPSQVLKKILPKSVYAKLSTGEPMLCSYINHMCSKNAQIPPIHTIGRGFFGLPHMRVVLYDRIDDKSLLKQNESPEENANTTYSKLKSIGIYAPFDISSITQPPLVIQCFLCEFIDAFERIPRKTRVRCVSNMSMGRKLERVMSLRTEVKRIDQRVVSLRSDIVTLEGKRRAQTALRTRAPVRRVHWDPDIVAMAMANPPSDKLQLID